MHARTTHICAHSHKYKHHTTHTLGYYCIIFLLKCCVWCPPGGTDIIACFAGHNCTGEVYRGEIQCRVLGMAVECWNEDGMGTLSHPLCSPYSSHPYSSHLYFSHPYFPTLILSTFILPTLFSHPLLFPPLFFPSLFFPPLFFPPLFFPPLFSHPYFSHPYFSHPYISHPLFIPPLFFSPLYFPPFNLVMFLPTPLTRNNFLPVLK